MQETNFPFIHHVVDDASTDDEQEVIKTWMERECDMDNAECYDNDLCTIILAKAKNNPHYTLAAYLLKKNMYGNPKKMDLVKPWRVVCPYEALCEGDDYWIDPKKLKKQVDYMDSHPSCSMCFTGAMVKFDESFENVDLKVYHSLYNNLQDRDYDGQELLLNWLTPFASIIHRTSVDIKRNPSFMFGDVIIVLSCAAQGKVHCLSEKMVVYRRNANGVSAKSQPLPRVINHYSAIAENFGKKYSKACNHLIYSSIASSLFTGNKSERQDALSALKEHPSCILNVVSAIVSICFNVLVNKFK